MEEISFRQTLFYCFAFVLIGSASGVVFHRNPIKSALFLIAFFVSLAAMYALIGAETLATFQVLVYVGAIMVLFLFVIMLIAIREENFESPGHNLGRTVTISVLTLAFLLQIFMLLQLRIGKVDFNPFVQPSAALKAGQNLTDTTQVIGVSLFSEYLVAFELVSLLLLVAVVGAIMIAKHNRKGPE